MSRVSTGDAITAVGWPRGRDAFVDVTGAPGSTDASWTVTGRCPGVLDAPAATDLVVAATTPDGPALFRVSTTSAGVRLEARANLDNTRRQADVDLDQAAAQVLATGDVAELALKDMSTVAATAIAAECVGGLATLVELASSHARTRFQFGRAIGSFQAIKHHCADMLVSLELSRSLAEAAAVRLTERDQTTALTASMAKAYCADAFKAAADITLQIHGGMGYSWEHPCHLYLRRAKTNQALWGSPAWHRGNVARLMGLAPVSTEANAC